MSWTRSFSDLIVDIYVRFSRDAGSFLAATISYYALFSIFPVLLLAISAAGFFVAEREMTQIILDYTKEALPQFSHVVRTNVQSIAKNRESTGIVGLVALFWIGTAVFDAITYALNRVWDVETPRHFITSKLLSVAAVIIAILLLIATTLFSTMFGTFQAFWRETFAVAPPLQAFQFTTFLGTLMITFAALVIIYSVVPNKRLRFGDVWVGAAFTTIVLEIAKRLFIVYTSRIARFNAIYGSVGVIVGLLFWLYIMGMIFVLGAEINAALTARGRTTKTINKKKGKA